MPNSRCRGWIVPLAMIGVIGLLPAEARADAFSLQLALVFGVKIVRAHV